MRCHRLREGVILSFCSNLNMEGDTSAEQHPCSVDLADYAHAKNMLWGAIPCSAAAASGR